MEMRIHSFENGCASFVIGVDAYSISPVTVEDVILNGAEGAVKNSGIFCGIGELLVPSSGRLR